MYLLESTLPFQYIWMANAASELATLAFYIASGISFRQGLLSCCGGSRASLAHSGLRPVWCVGGEFPALAPLRAQPQRWVCHAQGSRAVVCRPMPAGHNPYFQLTEEEAIELTKAEQEENP